MRFKTQPSGSPHQPSSCHRNINMYACHSNPIQTQLSIISVYLNRQEVWQVANNPSNLAIKDISFALLFTGNISPKASLPVLTKVTQSWSPGLCVVSRGSKGAGAVRFPKSSYIESKAARASLCPLHLCPLQNSNGTGIEELRREFILERVAETLDMVQTQR